MLITYRFRILLGNLKDKYCIFVIDCTFVLKTGKFKVTVNK